MKIGGGTEEAKRLNYGLPDISSDNYRHFYQQLVSLWRRTEKYAAHMSSVWQWDTDYKGGEYAVYGEHGDDGDQVHVWSWSNEDCLHNGKANKTGITNRSLVQSVWISVVV